MAGNADAQVRVLDFADEATQAIAEALGAGPGADEGLATEATLAARFGAIDQGEPIIVDTVGPTAIAEPAVGKRVRLKWLSLVLDGDESTLRATVRWDGGDDVYLWPLGRVPVFMHSSVRQGAVGQALEVLLSGAGEDVIVNLDWEEVDG